MKQIAPVLLVGLVLVVISCKARIDESTSVEELISILQTPDSASFALSAGRLGEMGSEASSASLTLAQAMQYPRHDAYVAAEALIKIGPAAKEAIPELLNALDNERPEVRANASIVLGVIGDAAYCVVPKLAQYLWDEAPEVSSSAARALDGIIGISLVDQVDKLTTSTSIIYDESISERARSWWLEEGQHQDWNREYDWCPKSR